MKVDPHEDEGVLLLFVERSGLDLPLEKSPEITLDVAYGEEDEVPYILMNFKLENLEVFARIPYGESWDLLTEGDKLVLVFQGKGDPQSWPMLVIGINDFIRGVVFGAKRLWEEFSQTYD
ncbi:MAG: hypothetical protein GXO39_08185 [Thermotogae bacterium]|nr:hypothetical protein [Thermotogota bacterium]